MSVSLSELSTPELRRTLSELASFLGAPINSETIPHGTDADVGSALPPESGMSAVLISNQCMFDIGVRQLGMDEIVSIPAGSSR